MIHTNSNDYEAAEQLGARIKGAVNRRYRLLEIELDAVYRSMLLLKKKKYAAVKVGPTLCYLIPSIRPVPASAAVLDLLCLTDTAPEYPADPVRDHSPCNRLQQAQQVS